MMNRRMSFARNVYTPGSVDSWDMENVKFLRKMSNGGVSALDSTDSVSYNSDNDSAVFDNRTVIGEVSESDDEKVFQQQQRAQNNNSNNRSSVYIGGGGHNHNHHSYNNESRKVGGEPESDYGMVRSNDLQSPSRLLDEALYSGGNGFALLNKSIVMKQMKSMAKSTLKDPYLEEEEEDAEPESIIEPTTIVRNKVKTPAALGGGGGCGLSRKSSRSEETNITNLNFDRRFMKSRKPKPSLVTLGFMEPQLEDCYLLDVMTIRNESVLAERSHLGTSHCAFSDSQDSETEALEKILKLNGNNSRRNGSAGLPSSSSSSVSSEEFNSAREGSYFPSNGEDDPIEIHRESSPDENRASSCSPVSVVVRGECATKFPITGETYAHSSERSFATASSNYYYLGQQQEDFEAFEDNRKAFDHGSDHDHGHHPAERDTGKQQHSQEMRVVDVETPRSASPYYVRLRRDLIPPSYTPPHPRQPWNFGMNRQGLLVIDYSPNWDGLESYVRSLSLK